MEQEFTKIESENPIVIPQVEEKVFDNKWIEHLRINSTDTQTAVLVCHLVPYNGSEILHEPKEMITIENIFQAMQDPDRPAELRTLFAQVMEGLLQAVKGEKAYQKAKAEAERVAQEALLNNEIPPQE